MNDFILDQFHDLWLTSRQGKRKKIYNVSFTYMTCSTTHYILPNFIDLGSKVAELLNNDAQMPWEPCLLFVATSMNFSTWEKIEQDPHCDQCVMGCLHRNKYNINHNENNIIHLTEPTTATPTSVPPAILHLSLWIFASGLWINLFTCSTFFLHGKRCRGWVERLDDVTPANDRRAGV